MEPAARGSRMAADIHWLHEAVMVLCTAILLGVFGFMFWACYAHRKSRGTRLRNSPHPNTTVEILWTVIPAVILVGIAGPTTRVLVGRRTRPTRPQHQVTGYQGKWATTTSRARRGIIFISTLSTPRANQIENKAPKGRTLHEVDNELSWPVGKKIASSPRRGRDSLLVDAGLRRQADAVPGSSATWFRPERPAPSAPVR